MWLKKISMFLGWIFFVNISLPAQQKMSIQELVNKALNENYQLQIVRNWEQMAQNENTLGNAGFLPSVDLRADQLWGVQNTEQRFFNGDVRSGDNALSSRRDAMLEVNWIVFDGFRMFANRDRLSNLAQLGNTDTRYYIEQTIADISTLYYQLVMELQMLESLKKSLDISEFRLKLESQKRNVGTGNALLYHQAKIDFNADSALVVNRNMMIRELQFKINRIISEEPGFDILPDLTSIDLKGFADRETLLQKILENNSELDRARLEELIAESNIRMERAARYPQVSVFGNYSYAGQNNEVGFIESSVAYGGQYGIRVRFNLYNGGRQNTRIKNVLLEQENATVSLKDTRAVAESHLASLINAYDSYLLQAKLLEQSLKAAESSLEIAREQLQAGIISGFEFRQAQLASLRVENQIVGLIYAMKSIEIDIYRISGDLPEMIL